MVAENLHTPKPGTPAFGVSLQSRGVFNPRAIEVAFFEGLAHRHEVGEGAIVGGKHWHSWNLELVGIRNEKRSHLCIHAALFYGIGGITEIQQIGVKTCMQTFASPENMNNGVSARLPCAIGKRKYYVRVEALRRSL
jgi:hypothetical protein